MLAVIPFPDISPEVFPWPIFGYVLPLRWYALAYIAGILIGWRILIRLAARPDLWRGTPPYTARQAEDWLTWAILGIILGGRLGFVLFYQPGYFLSHPLDIPKVWHGGMSFHGGFLGIAVAMVFFCRQNRIRLSALADAMALATPVGLFLGRIANFINAELWGRPSHLPWAVVFPGAAAQDCGPDWIGPCARHPSQLYEAGLEGIVLGLVIWLAVRRGALARPWFTTGLFLAGYGVARFVVEFFRLADPQYITPGNPHGHVLGGPVWGVTMGQLLSLPMIALGVLLMALALRRARAAPA